MNQPLRSTTAVSIVILSSMIAGCAAPHAKFSAASPSVATKPLGDGAFASRALEALNANQIPQAIDLAEKAVAKSPTEDSVRTLLGNAYFAAGRFSSAEAAFRESLTLNPDQPQVALKLALVQIGQGKNHQAVAFLNSARDLLDASDYGLALALAGRPAEAIPVLDRAARTPGSDAMVRQNLALAHALAGDWTEARTIAAQDVPAAQLDARIQQWMQLAVPKRPGDQVAALTGVRPAAFDGGEPVQLALNKANGNIAVAQAAPAAAPAPVMQKAADVAPAPRVTVAVIPSAPAPAPVVRASVPPAPPPPRPTLATLAASAVTEAKAVLASVMPHSQPARKPATHPKPQQRPVQVAMHHGNAPTVVQLGAYGSPERVLAAWNVAAKKYGALKAYLPMSARFQSAKGTFYRLSVRGFETTGEANGLCASLRREGAKCFVRNFAGDAPVQYASR